MEEIEKKVLEIVVEVSQEESVRENKNIDLLEEDVLDSLAFIMLIERLNEEFNIDIQPTQVSSNSWRNIYNIAKMVEKYIEGK